MSKRICVYHPHHDASVAASGAELVVVALAHTLAKHGQVDLVHHKPNLSHSAILANYGIDLADTTLRYLPKPSEVPFHRPVRRYLSERGFARFGAHYDLMVASAHELPPFCAAQAGALYIHFPAFSKSASWPWHGNGRGLRAWIRRGYANLEWGRRFSGYQKVMVNSEFTAQYVRDWWGLSPTVVYPACGVRLPSSATTKSRLIASVGRFTTAGTSKNQLEMMKAFSLLRAGGVSDWEYTSMGALGPEQAHQAYFKQVQDVALESGARVLSDIPRSELEEVLGHASIFWHGAGLNAGSVNPLLLEHFGIVTVEAMAAGCVPVVISRGGQCEIVEHGVSGFLWDSLDELQGYTLQLMRDPDLLIRMSQAAKVRAERFGLAAFSQRVEELLIPLLVPRTARRRAAPVAGL